MGNHRYPQKNGWSVRCFPYVDRSMWKLGVKTEPLTTVSTAQLLNVYLACWVRSLTPTAKDKDGVKENKIMSMDKRILIIYLFKCYCETVIVKEIT